MFIIQLKQKKNNYKYLADLVDKFINKKYDKCYKKIYFLFL